MSILVKGRATRSLVPLKIDKRVTALQKAFFIGGLHKGLYATRFFAPSLVVLASAKTALYRCFCASCLCRLCVQLPRVSFTIPALSLAQVFARVRARFCKPRKKRVSFTIPALSLTRALARVRARTNQPLKCFVCLAKASSLYDSKLSKSVVE